jgi:hypothetical protein
MPRRRETKNPRARSKAKPRAMVMTPLQSGAVRLALIKGIAVVQEGDGRVQWESGAAVDADGANGQNGNPFAYRADNKGLDDYRNAGWPNRSWDSVLIDNGHGQPTDDGNDNWYSQTTYTWKNRPAIADHYVDATAVPYIVVNPIVRMKARGVVIGCKARATYNGKSINAVVADVSGAKDIGELSIAAAQELGMPSSPRTGGVDSNVTFEFWPGVPAVVNGETYDLQPA